MRSLVVLALLATTPAVACPLGARCVREAPDNDETPAPRKPISLRVDQLEVATWTFDKPASKADEDMPWIWEQLRRSVIEQLPRYRDESLTFVLSPVVVNSVPGLGIAGDF